MRGDNIAPGRRGLYAAFMFRSLLAATLLLATPALAQQQAPSALGTFQDWTAATYRESGQLVCYAFTRAQQAGGVAGREAETVLLLVTHRRGARDQVAVRPGFAFAAGADGTLVIGESRHAFFTAADTAFGRDSAALVAAMRAGRDAVFRAPGPAGRGETDDRFSLMGFTASYNAISRACPP